MNTQVHLLSLANTEKVLNNRSSSGFTVLETLVIVLLIGLLAALGIPNWMTFVATRQLNTAQSEVYYAMRQAQSEAIKQKLAWQASFREQNGVVQWAVHPATVNSSNANWNNLDANVQLDPETTLEQTNGVRQIKFDRKGNIKEPPLGRITLSSKSGGKAKRCVIVSTILGAMRTAKEHTTRNDGKYCY